MQDTKSLQRSDQSSVLSSGSKSSVSFSVLENTKRKIFSYLSGLAQKKFVFQGVIFFFLELCFWLEIIIHCLLVTLERSQDIGEYIEIVIKPSFSIYPYISIFSFSIFLMFFTVVVFFNIKNRSDIFESIVTISLRVFRTIFFIPLMYTLLLSIRFDFKSYEALSFSDSPSIFDFPYFFFAISSTFIFIFFYLLGSIDILLFCDSLKSINYLTSSTSGRSQFFLFSYVSISIFTDILLSVDEFYIKIIHPASCFIFSSVVLIYVLRVTPFYKKGVNFFFGGVIGFCVGCHFSGIFLVFFSSVLSYLSFGSILIIWLITMIFIIIRYLLLFSRAKNKNFSSNILFLSRSEDIGLIFYSLSSSDKVNNKDLLELLRNEHYKDSLKISNILISIFITRDISLCSTIIGHAKGINGKSFFDTQFFFTVWREVVADLIYTGENNQKNRKFLRIIRNSEEKLTQLYRQVFERMLVKETKSINTSGFNYLIEEICNVEKEIEDNYLEVLKKTTNPEYFRKFGRYLEKFHNNKTAAERYYSQAKLIDMIDSGSHFEKVTKVKIFSSEELNDQNFTDEILEKETIAETAISMGSQQSKSSKRSLLRGEAIFHKIYESRIWSLWFFRVAKYMTFFFFFLTVGIVCGFGFSTVAAFAGTQERLDMMSEVRKEATGVAHFWRKVQISTYPYPYTYFDHERNTESFINRTEVVCEKLSTYVNEIYSLSSSSELDVWKNTELELYERILNEPKEDSKNNSYALKNYSLLDAVIKYVDSCTSLLELTDSEIGNRNIGSRLEDNNDFMFIIKNEGKVHNGLEEKLLESEIQHEEKKTNRREFFLLFPVPVYFCFSVFILFLSLIFWEIEQNKSFKIFEYFPKVESQRLFLKFGGKVGKETKRLTTSYYLFFRIYFIKILLLLIFSFASLLVISIFGIYVNTQFSGRTIEYDYSNRLSVLVHRIHLWVVELLYREDSLKTEEEVISGLRSDLSKLETGYKQIRFGDSSISLPQTDTRELFRELYYEWGDDGLHDHGCTTMNTSMHKINIYLYELCTSMSQSFYELVSKSERLISNHSISQRGSDTYEHIIYLDNVVSEKANNDGILQHKLNYLKYLTSIENESINYFFRNMNWLTVILLPLLFLFLFYILNRNFEKKMRLIFTKSKLLFLLLKKDFLKRNSIYEFLTTNKHKMGKENGLKKISFCSKKKIEDDYSILNLLEKNDLPILVFDKGLNIIYYNKELSIIFNLKDLNYNLSFILNDDSINRIKRFILKGNRKKKNKQFECIALTNNVEFLIKISISTTRGKQLFFAIIENIQTKKKKEEHTLKKLSDANYRTQEISQLLQTILPTEIAKTFNFKSGKSYSKYHKEITALFADIVQFTQMSNEMKPNELVKMLHNLFSSFDDLCQYYKMEKIKTIGDAFFAVNGCPKFNPLHYKDTMNFAIHILYLIKTFNKTFNKKIEMRIGISSGPATAGIIGKRKFQYDIWSEAINKASRMESNSEKGKILVSEETYTLLYDQFQGFEKKVIDAKGFGQTNAYLYTPTFEEKEIKFDLNIVKDFDSESNENNQNGDVFFNEENQENQYNNMLIQKDADDSNDFD